MVNRKRKIKAMEQPDENVPAIEPSEQATPQRQSKRTKKRERLKILKELSHFLKRRLKSKSSKKMQHQLTFLKR